MYAIIETGGKQYRVTEGQVIYVEKLEVEAGNTVSFNRVLMAGDKIGMPFVANATVDAVVEKQGKSKKVIIFKYKPKKDSRKKQGHRQPYTKLTIQKINA